MRHLLGQSSVEVCPSLPAAARLAVWTPDGQPVEGIHHASAPGIAVAFTRVFAVGVEHGARRRFAQAALGRWIGKWARA
jgi:hypothetical protein